MIISALLALSTAHAGVCDDYNGQAFGLCNAYCEAMDCDGDPNANQNACDAVYANFSAATGEAPPCEITEYTVRTVYSGDDSVEVYVDGVLVPWQLGDDWWSSENSHQTTLSSGDHTIAFHVWDVARVIAGLGAFVEVDGAITARTDDGSSFLTTQTYPGTGWADVGFSDSGWAPAQTCSWDPWNSVNLTELDANGIVWAWANSSCNNWSDGYDTWYRVNLTLP